MSLWLGPDDARWKMLLGSVRHDFYHLPEYGETVCSTQGGMARAYYCDTDSGFLLIPLVVRDIPPVLAEADRLRDAISPYGYAGPVFSEGITDRDLERALEEFIRFGIRERLVTTFLRLHTLMGERLAKIASGRSAASVVDHGPTVSIDLRAPADALMKTPRENHRRNVKALLNRGFTARVDHWCDYGEFQRIYRDNMMRVAANGSYLFDGTYFQRLLDFCRPFLHLCSVVDPQGTLAAAGLFTLHGGIAQYHLGGTSERHVAYAPTKLMLCFMRDWLKASGATVFHLGGGRGAADDSLLRFKRGFATDEHRYRSVRIVHDPQAYAALSGQWLRSHGVSAFSDEAYFPLYRSTDGASRPAIRATSPASGISG